MLRGVEGVPRWERAGVEAEEGLGLVPESLFWLGFLCCAGYVLDCPDGLAPPVVLVSLGIGADGGGTSRSTVALGSASRVCEGVHDIVQFGALGPVVTSPVFLVTYPEQDK